MKDYFGISVIDLLLCKVLKLESLLWVEGCNYPCFYTLWVTWKYTLSYFSEITRLVLITHCTVDGLRLPSHLTMLYEPHRSQGQLSMDSPQELCLDSWRELVQVKAQESLR